MTSLEIFAVIRQIVMMVTGLGAGSVVIRNPNIGSPSGEYCSIDPTGPVRRYGKGGSKFTNVGPVPSPIGNVMDVNQEVKQHVLRDISLSFYRGEANDYAVMMSAAPMRSDVHEMLIRSGLGWVSTGAVNDLTALQSNNYEQRAELTIIIASLQTQNVTTNAIYQIPTTVQDDSGTVVATQTINVPTE